MIAVMKKCQYCDTALEFDSDGQWMVFTAHDDAFCFALTKARVVMLEQAMLGQREAYERRVARLEHDMDRALAEHGLPSLAERRAAAEREAAILREVIRHRDERT